MKLIGFGMTLGVLIMFNSCSIDRNQNLSAEFYSEDFVVPQNGWSLVGRENSIGSYYEYVVDGLPLDISYQKGIVSVYMYQDFDTEYEVQVPLPHTVPVAGRDYYYSILYTYDIKYDGTIAFRAYISDYDTGVFRPLTERFRVAIAW